MTFQQGLSFAVLAGTMALFIWGRWRYDMVAVAGLLAGLLLGTIPAEKAFSGFSNDIVIIVGSALVVSAAVARTGLVERARRDAAHDAERRTLTDRLAQLERQLAQVVGPNPPRRPA